MADREQSICGRLRLSYLSYLCNPNIVSCLRCECDAVDVRLTIFLKMVCVFMNMHICFVVTILLDPVTE